jgi:N-glycosylase/DNA lyase
MKIALILDDLIGHLLCEIERNQELPFHIKCEREPHRIWETFVFCILASQVTSEKARKACGRIMSHVPFFDSKTSFTRLEEQIISELKHKDIRHRFPYSKARQIAHSWFAFAQVRDEFDEYLLAFSSERQARQHVVATFPGLGMKQASMMLRDIGYSNKLAIIDTHILWYFAQSMNLETSGVTTKQYLELEDRLIQQADRYRVEPNVLDAAIWAAVRSLKARACLTQCV